MPSTIRAAGPSDAGQIARVHVDSWRTTYKGIVPGRFLAGLSYSKGESEWSQILAKDQPSTFLFVAETESGEVVGFSHGGPKRGGGEEYSGELYTIYVLEEHQGRGLGRLLISAVAQALLENGLASMLLWVMEDNHCARRVYECMGGELVSRGTFTVGGQELSEVSYGWKDISVLVPETSPLPSQE